MSLPLAVWIDVRTLVRDISDLFPSRGWAGWAHLVMQNDVLDVDWRHPTSFTSV